LPGLIDEALKEVKAEKYPEAFEAFDKFLKALGIFGTISGDGLRVVSEWAHNMNSEQRDAYNRWLSEFSSIRERLRRTVDPRTKSEVPRMGDIEWDLGSVRHDFIEWVEPFFRDEDDEFTHGPFKIILTEDARDGLEESMKTLDLASAKIRSSKFDKVLYGKVFVTRGVKDNKAGSYVPARDSINLSLYAIPDRDSVMTLIHEFGHRYHTRFLDHEARQKFIRLSEEGDYEVFYFNLGERKKLADEYIALLLKHRIGEFPTKALSDEGERWFHNYPRDEWKTKVVPFIRKFRDDADDTVEEQLREALGKFWLGGNVEVESNKDHRTPLYASPYGSTNWTENFAECFLHYIIGKALPPPLQKFMDSL
jgi:hypothetical protein